MMDLTQTQENVKLSIKWVDVKKKCFKSLPLDFKH